MQVIRRKKNEEKEKPKKKKSSAITEAIKGAAEMYGKHVEKKAATKKARETFAKENPVTKKQPLPSFSTSQKSFR